jgi:hypothetical protein
MMNVAVDPKDGWYLADGLGAGKYQLSVRVGVGIGPDRSPEAVELGRGETLTKDIRINAPRPGGAGGRE